tara:strand:- start:274 stop:774 length:501 start_codon:yes stop_codon:yes gene_type:complete
MERAGVIAEINQDSMKYYLLVLGDEAGKWSLVKGHLEEGEGYKECAQREFYEEVGQRCQIPEGANVWIDNGTQYFYLIFPEMFEPTPIDIAEIRQAKWFSQLELCALDPAMCNSGLKRFITMINVQPDDGFVSVVKKEKPRRGRQACRSFMAGECRFGAKCRYKHV